MQATTTETKTTPKSPATKSIAGQLKRSDNAKARTAEVVKAADEMVDKIDEVAPDPIKRMEPGDTLYASDWGRRRETGSNFLTDEQVGELDAWAASEEADIILMNWAGIRVLGEHQVGIYSYGIGCAPMSLDATYNVKNLPPRVG